MRLAFLAELLGVFAVLNLAAKMLRRAAATL